MKRFLFLVFISFLMASCARVGSPVGGAKDSIPPQVIGSNIDSPRVNVPRDIRELRIDFDEYITLKDINKQLIISPPLKRISKILPSGMGNKYLLIKWADTLEANTTYNFNFGNAIVDNNEGNALGYYNFAFSTGPKIDSLYISGELKSLFIDQNKKADESNMVVGLYQEKDSMDYRQKPYYIAKADPDGYFELNYLAPGNYRVLAFEDSNANSVYDIGKEKVGFLKDKITLDKSISGLDINLYPSKKTLKYLEMKEIPGGILMTFEGNPTDVKVVSLNEKLKDYKVTHSPKSDSATIWFNAPAQNIGITNNENLKFSYDNGVKKDSVSLFYRYNTKNEMSISNNGGNSLAPKQDFVVTSNYFVDKIQPEKWTLVSDSIKQDFTAEISEKNPFEIHIKSDFKEGKKYSLTIPKETVSSFFEKNKVSKRFDFEADKIENYGEILVTLENAPEQKFWIQMINENGSVAYSKYGNEKQINFKSIKPGKYELRMLVDANENGIWDSADFADHTFAEPVYVLDKKIEVRPLWEIRETWRIPTEIPENTGDLKKSPTEKPIIIANPK
ncbi:MULTISPECIES: Ig-like domain-containing domain [unclassified Kaistella]|uniref:Ig-like domain-containing domain n=1 Tax=unclassified Kaistella TaxID=2762626 RepID=UPI00273719CA|nr:MULTISPECIES: Ig-like domain-containing domain [unclassified Kaistella]MDP2452757.1 Ig-like domain-containing domain [Kaistella sp. SH11-4b]MDP2455666.1 Ig-like domain-containing domain [Kaistella sp. SH40-3]MDP2458570.1 Ig-like domain-containing domain [Kaistella sp. SH19-2b]